MDVGFHGMSEAFELRSGYSPSCLLADPLGLLCGGEREPGKKKKTDEEGIATLGEKCVGLDFEAQPVGFVDEMTGMWNGSRQK